ncbi:MAG: tRNA (adenosine(37)-N6)-threonylcarbamoyltransferase complex dimerization subunit type 1 TsaB [Acidobacteriota bacterium]|nr:tRNA (adenosine(37)-N6)-threonylcarbamoyltransferase complex dimerization subunit type 1 TsaB [Acidobacteriota bacterium]
MPMLVLAIDTCGAAGSVALARIGEADAGDGPVVEILGQEELAAKTYSATLIRAIERLLGTAQYRVAQLGAVVAVSGPGSFTGVRVGLSTVKGLAEPNQTPVATVSRLEVLAKKAGLDSAALDAHRGEVFLRLGADGREVQELLAGAAELAAVTSPPSSIAVCDDSAQKLIENAWPGIGCVRVTPPTAADALRVAAADIVAGLFADLALLDGHYLRRSDAEIFGEKAASRASEK